MQERYQEQSIKQTYIKYFVRNVLVPVSIIFIISILAILYFSKQDADEQMELIEMQVIDALEKELYDDSIQFSQLLLADNETFLGNLNQYFTVDSNEKYAYSVELQKQYEIAILTSYSLIGIQCFGENEKSYSFKNDMSDLRMYIEELPIYIQAQKESGKVHFEVVDISTIYPNIMSNKNRKILMFFYSPSESGQYSETDMIIMSMYSPTLDLIQDTQTWADNTSMYLLDNENNLLISSDDEYVQDLESVLAGDKLKLENVSISQESVSFNNWNLITIISNTAMSEGYRNILLGVFLAVLILFIMFYKFILQLLNTIIHPINNISDKMNNVENEQIFEKLEEGGLKEINIIRKTYNQMIIRIQSLIEQNAEKEREKRREVIRALEYQINPHFLSNTVNSIQYMAKVAKFESVEYMAESLNKILVVTFRNKDEKHLISEELDVLEAYIYIMQIRYSNGFEVHMNIDEAAKSCMVPKLILQPFIENAIIHGFYEMVEQGIIMVEISINVNNLKFVIEDNGIGISETDISKILEREPENGKSVAIANINKRLRLSYGEAFNIRILSEKGKYTRIEFSIPIDEIT